MYRKAILFPLFLFFSVAALHAQEIKGKVTDIAGMPLQGASVRLLNSDRGTATGADGSFRISAGSGKRTLIVTSVGYASRLVEISSGKDAQHMHIMLSPASAMLDELVVTSEKTEERPEKVANAVSVITAREVRDYRLWDIREITGIIPNLYSSSSGDQRNVTSVRGIATTSYEQAIATYIDGVNQFSLDTYMPQLLDIERIEVLRGPQGTLYGRNAMGGVINIITRKPGNRTDVQAELTAGNHGQQRYTLALKTPIIRDKLYAGASGLFERRNGYYTNLFNGKTFDDQGRYAGNYFLRFLPSQTFTVSLNIKHQDGKNEGAFPLNPSKADALLAPFTLNQDAVSTMRDRTWNASLSMQYRKGGLRLESITSWQQNQRIYRRPIDGDLSPLDAISIVNDYGGRYNRVRVFTQEFRIHSAERDEDKLTWSAGAFMFRQDNPTLQGTRFGRDAPLLGIPDSNFTLVSRNDGRNTGLAGYGQAQYRLGKGVQIIAGLRYDLEHRRLAVAGTYEKGSLSFPTRPDTSASGNFSALSPKLGFRFDISGGCMAYLLFSRGYRAGGFTTLGSDPGQLPLAPYDPEHSHNLELGWKYFPEHRRLRLNVYLFYSFINNVQTPTLILPDAVTVIRNAGKLNSWGAEFELSATPIKGLDLVLNLGATDARYRELNLPADGAVADLSGNRQVFTPVGTAIGVLQYSRNIKDKLRLFARLETRVMGKQYFDLANRISQDGYLLLHARLGIDLGRAEFSFWGRNLGGLTYLAYGYDFGGVHLGDPRTWGITLSIRR